MPRNKSQPHLVTWVDPDTEERTYEFFGSKTTAGEFARTIRLGLAFAGHGDRHVDVKPI